MAADPKEIVKAHQRLIAKRSNNSDRWERQAPFIAPSRVGITSDTSPGEKQTRGVYDSTTMMAAELLGHFVAGHLINPSQQWLNWTPLNTNRDTNDNLDEEREWCEESRTRSLGRLGASLFYAEGPEALIDWGGFGTGWMIGEENSQPINLTIKGFRGFMFHAEKTGRFYIEEGINGLVDRTHREYKMTASGISEKFGPASQPDRKPLPEVIQKCIDEGDPDKEFKVIHAIYPRPKSQQHGGGATGYAWASVWVLLDSKELLKESGYRTFPVAIPRYQRTPGDPYGRGRGDIAFPDTWTLNSAKRMGFEDWALKIRPPILHGHDSVIGSLRLIPGGPTSINTHGRPLRDVIQPFETGSRPEISHINEEELRKSIRSIFYVEQILALLEVNKSEMSAFEFARKIELLFRIVGPVYGRVEWEWLYRIAEITFVTQLYAGDFSPPPQSMIDEDGQIRVGVLFQNPIARAQRSGDAEAFMMAMNDIGAYATQFPQVLDWIDPDELAQGILADVRGVPAKWMRNKKEVEDIRSERAKQQSADLEAQRMEQLAGAAGKAAPMIAAVKKPNEAVTTAA